MLIKNCSIDDIASCASLLIQVYSNPESAENWKYSDAIRYLERFHSIDPAGCYIALMNKEIAGAIFSYSYPWQSETLVYIQELFVSPGHRKKGIAKSLLKSISNDEKNKAWLVFKEGIGAADFSKVLLLLTGKNRERTFMKRA